MIHKYVSEKTNSNIVSLTEILPQNKTMPSKMSQLMLNPYLSQSCENEKPLLFSNMEVAKRSFWKVFSIPEVLAVSPSATERMENAEKHVKFSSSCVSELEVQEYIRKETGFDRLYTMVQKDNTGEHSQEFNLITGCMMQSSTMTFIVMSVLAGKDYREEFIRKHRSTVYSSRFQASRRFTDAIFIESMKEGAKWGVKVGLFAGTFVGISQCISVYRNKSSPFEYAIAAGITGGISKATLGLRGIVSGSVFGTLFGLVGGTIIYGVMYASNLTQDSRHAWSVQKLLTEEKQNKGHISPHQKL